MQAAAETFYAEGINRTGVDRLVDAAGITRATFYRHFPSKEDLVLAYVRERDADLRGRAAAAVEATGDPRAQLEAVIHGLAESIVGNGFRGCPFINTAAEYPDPSGPVRQAIDAHRVWFRASLAKLLRGSGHDAPEFAADLIVLLRDGSQVGASLDEAAAVQATFLRAVAGVVGP